MVWKGLEQVLLFLFPQLALQGTPWRGIWRERDREATILIARSILPLAALAMVANHLWVDIPLGLTPLSDWRLNRLGAAAFCLAMFLLTLLPSFRRWRWYRAPLVLSSLVVAGAQAITVTWYPSISPFHGMAIGAGSAVALRLSPALSVLYLAAIFSFQLHCFSLAGTELMPVASGMGVALVLVVAIRAGMLAEIRTVISQQTALSTQKRLIEAEMDLNREIRAFLPTEIYRRLLEQKQRHRFTYLQAMDEVLRPRLATIGCLFSDIRGFTQRSRDLPGYLFQGALPNIKMGTEVVESSRGIPRLVGDLIFAYFDAGSPEENLIDATYCALRLVEQNERWNATVDEEFRVRRFVLLAFGPAVVGNIGGSRSAREITALGSCVNLLARIDALTKDPALAPLLDVASLIVTADSARALRFCVPSLELEEIDLGELGLELRDFPHEHSLFLLKADDQARAVVVEKASTPSSVRQREEMALQVLSDS